MNRKISAPFHIQLAVDGSEYSTASTQLIRDLPLPPHSCITILGVVPPGQSLYGSKLSAALKQAGRKIPGQKSNRDGVCIAVRSCSQTID